MRKKKVYLILTWMAFCLMLGALIFEQGNTSSLRGIAGKASVSITEKADRLRELSEGILNGSPQKPDQFYNTEKAGLYLFVNDSIKYWNNAQVPLSSLAPFKSTEGVTLLRQGYYLYCKTTRNEKSAIAVCLLKSNYELQNNYLNNDFAGWTGIPGEVDIDTLFRSNTRINLHGKEVFAISGSDDHYYNERVDNVCAVIFITGFLLLLTGSLLIIHRKIRPRSFFIITGGVVLIRITMVLTNFPALLRRTLLYDVRLFGNAQSVLNGYLGDILLNAFTILFLAAAIYIYAVKVKKPLLMWRYFILPLVALFFTAQYNASIVSLVSNSTLNFDFLNIFNLTFPSLLALAAICVLSLAIFLIIKCNLEFFSTGSWKEFLRFTGVYVILGLILDVSTGATFFEAYWLVIFSVAMCLIINFRKTAVSLSLGLQIVLMSAITSVILNSYIEKNQKQDLQILSLTLSERQDPILENEFMNRPEAIKNDKSLRNLINILPNTSEAIEQLLNQKYFNEYFNRYNVSFSLFDHDCRPLLDPVNPLLLNEGYLLDQVNYFSDSTSAKDLYFIQGHKSNSRYIGVVPLGEFRLYVMMEPKQFEEMGSFPDLLLDRSQQKHEKLKNFSYAVYRAGQNTSHYGNFNYPLFLPDEKTLSGSDPSFIHRFFTVDETTIVISRPSKTWIYFFTFNSYLLLFFSFVTYCCYLVYALLFTTVFRNSSLTRRIQTIIIVLLLVAMSAIGFTSTKLVINQFETENKKQLREKTGIIINELLGQFKPEVIFEPTQRDLVNLKLNEFSRLFNTDISLFTAGGKLFNTSQPRLYNLGLAARLANPRAVHELKNNYSSGVSIYEKAGSLNYLSLYTPLFDGDRKLIGFINLPYFARENDLVNELSGIVSALINVYVILFVVSILGGLIFSGYITKPLRLIQQQISNITLGKKNEKIVWATNDEIGRLINEYNQMLLKLENSATLLAQSEREGAWREMAKQVAHEIKNPLTPMKLNLQYLQHLMKNDPQAFNDKFEKASAGIIEQINSLANIANEFSNFASLPGTRLQTINLAEAINTSLLLFENQKNILIDNRISEGEMLVKGDRDQCIRVFNNILKNAVQALEEIPGAMIEISCEHKEDTVIVSVKDNGSGIAEDLRPKIFTPNFTTKSTGSGLGLAMVKNIMEGFGGKIWFSSGANGTVFYIEFLKV